MHWSMLGHYRCDREMYVILFLAVDTSKSFYHLSLISQFGSNQGFPNSWILLCVMGEKLTQTLPPRKHIIWGVPTSSLPGKSHGRRSLVGYSPWSRKESDTTEQLHFPFSFSCIGEGNGNPLQCSCLENPRDGGAWWAAIYGVAQSRTRLKRFSSSTSSLAIFAL